MSTSTAGYEFSTEQNELIGSLAGKMRFVGLFAVIVGVMYSLMTILVIVGVYRDRIPADWQAKVNDYVGKAREKLPDDVRKQADEYSLDKLPPNDHLWGIAFSTGFAGLFYLLIGIWTRSAGGSFQNIVDQRGNDMKQLMDGLGSLHHLYSLLYTLLVVVLLAGIISLGLTLFKYYGG